MLEPLLFSPAALWLSEALRTDGIDRIFVVCHADDRERVAACFPEGAEVVTDGTEDASDRLNVFLSRQEGSVAVFTQPVLLYALSAPCAPALSGGAARQETGAFEIAAGVLAAGLLEGKEFKALLHGHGAQIDRRRAVPLSFSGADRVAGEQLARQRSAARLLEAGVRLMDPNTVYVDPTVTVGAGTVLLPGTILRGKTCIGSGCEIGPNAMIRDCTIGDGVTVNASQLNESTVEDGAKIGPFAYVRPHCHVGREVKVGDFVELKNSNIGDGTKISHLTYVGDSDVGGHVNFGCGTVTVNYDGNAKYRTVIGDHAFIGCNTNLVAPVQVGEGAYTAAGSTITDDVPGDSLAIARAQQVVKKNWAAKRRRK